MGPLREGHNSLTSAQSLSRRHPRPGTRIVQSVTLLALLLLPVSRAAGQLSSRGSSSDTPNRNSDGPTNPTSPPGNVGIIGGPGWFPIPTPNPHPACNAPGDYERRAEMLDKNGPQMPAIYTWNASQFSIMGFSKGNWPVFIDYSLEHAGTLLVVVAPDGRQPHVFLTNSGDGRTNTRFQLPASMGDDLRVSVYLIVPLDKNLGLHVFGISAGEKAVGSMGIDQVVFGPKTIQISQHQKAQYSFHAIKDFKKTSVTFIRLAKSNTGEIVAADVGDRTEGSVIRDGEKKGDWDGTPKPPKDALKQYLPEQQRWLLAPTGQHVLQVRGWFGANEGGDWVFASSDDQVSVE